MHQGPLMCKSHAIKTTRYRSRQVRTGCTSCSLGLQEETGGRRGGGGRGWHISPSPGSRTRRVRTAAPCCPAVQMHNPRASHPSREKRRREPASLSSGGNPSPLPSLPPAPPPRAQTTRGWGEMVSNPNAVRDGLRDYLRYPRYRGIRVVL